MLNMIKHWLVKEDGAALPEFALLFPIMAALLLGAFDIGRALVINQKMITASQIMADLIARNEQLTLTDLDDIILAGQMAIDPYDRSAMGYDIITAIYDADDIPQETCRVTENIEENDEAFDQMDGLGTDGSGILAVTVGYRYEPFFTEFALGTINMKEVAVFRGRRSSVITVTDC